MKLLILDLDGTLFNTKDVNYYAYKEAIEPYGYNIDYKYYCEFCNGRHYLDFLPQITTDDIDVLSAIHKKKKTAYRKYLDKAEINTALLEIVKGMKEKVKVAIVTTASKQNCMEILEKFEILELFDLVLTREDILKSKPDPEGFLKAMKHFNVLPEETVIFEDSDVGLEAAKKSGAFYYKTFCYN